jgi:H+/Cl- antiporter ClcA
MTLLKVDIYTVTVLDNITMTATDTAIYALFGTIIGFIGALLVTILKYLVLAKNHLFRQRWIGPYSYSLTILIIHIIFYEFVSQIGMKGDILMLIFDQEYMKRFSLSGNKLIIEWLCIGILHVLSLTCTIPSGNLVPLFILGGLGGKVFYPYAVMLGCKHPEQAFVLVGAGSMVLCVTHSVVSNTIKIFELSGQITNLIPSLIANLTGYIIASSL